MVRHWRMRGRPTLWVPGTDHAGIATQLVVEKELAKSGVKRTDLSRDEYGGAITNQIRRLGASCDWSREHFTLDPQLSTDGNDERYQKYVGRNAVVPMSGGREIPIIADEYVDREFGTGALKITPGHDQNDYAIGQRVGLPIINIMNKDGTLNANAAAYCGMDRFDARERLWQDLEGAGLAIKAEPYTTRVPRSQRGGEWFVRMEPLAAPALEAVRTGALQIVPDRFEKIYNFWLENIRDWCISRQLWWGHRIPVWYVVQSDAAAAAGATAGGEEPYVVAHSEEEAYEKARALYGADVALRQETDVLDTCGLWPFSTLGWPDESAPDFARFYPTAVLETGHDILFFWVARMIMMGIEFTGRVPFHTVYLHGLVRDAKGQKMSKSLGNVIDPLDTMGDYGTDALRFTLATGTTPGQDVNLSMERLGANRAFTNKLWNAGKFILLNLPPKGSPEWQALGAAAKFDTEEAVMNDVTKNYEKYEFNEIGRVIYDFFWSDFADWYIEASKTRLYKNEDASAAGRAQSVLVYVYDCVLRLLHPFMPFVTEVLWQSLPHIGDALIVAKWPALGLPRDAAAVARFEELQSLVRSVRNARAEYTVEPGKRIGAIVVAGPASLAFIQEESAVLVALCKLDPLQLQIVDSSSTPGEAEQAVHLVVAEGLEAYLPLAGMVDIAKEVDRLSKQAAKLEAELAAAAKRLSMPSFVEKAPAAVVQGVREQAAEAEEKLSVIKNRLVQLEAMATPAAK
eukprot:jgi/Mesen1/1721/ME000138S00585